MSLLLTCLGLLAAGGGCSRAGAEPSAIDPKQYLDQKAFEEAEQGPKAEAVKQNVVRIDGRPYYRFGDGKSSILVPKVDHLTPRDMERAVCAEDLIDVCDPTKANPDDSTAKEICDKQGMREAMASRAQQQLTKDTVVYLDLIVTTIQTTCGGVGRKPNTKRMQHLFELGLEKKNQDPRHPGAEKVFVRPNPQNPLKPEVGAGVSF